MGFREGAERPSSLPFLSGDTLRAYCGAQIVDGKLAHTFGERKLSLFASTDETKSKQLHYLVQEWADANPDQRPKTLVLHNGDYCPSWKTLRRLSKQVDRVLCVNTVRENKRIRAVPIGIENAHLGANGVVENFHKIRANPEQKSRLVLASFRTHTFERVRVPAARLFGSSRFGFVSSFPDSSGYLEEVARSSFVISPPGNGPDCHRTWEAIILGAVPIVLAGTLAPSLVSRLPIMQVKSYRELIRMTDSELREAHRDITSRSDELAFGRPWLDQLN